MTPVAAPPAPPLETTAVPLESSIEKLTLDDLVRDPGFLRFARGQGRKWAARLRKPIADDVMAETMRRLVARYPHLTFVVHAQAYGYIKLIAKSAAIDLVRKPSRREVQDETKWGVQSDWQQAELRHAREQAALRKQTLHEAIAKLPDQQRAIIERELDREPRRAICAALKISPATLKRRRAKALTALRQMLAPYKLWLLADDALKTFPRSARKPLDTDGDDDLDGRD